MFKSTRKILWSGVNLLAKLASRNYIAGANLEDAQRISEHLNKLGYWITLGYWDSVNDDVNIIFDIYNSSIKYLTGIPGNNYLSIKLPALKADHEKLHALLTKSQESGIPLHFDSLAPENADEIYDFVLSNCKQTQYQFGCTLPARWCRSIEDAVMFSSMKINVRVVKGQSEEPGYPDLDLHANYLAIIRKLAGGACTVRVATHNLDLARQSLTILKAQNTNCELELLYGLPINGLVSLAMQIGVPVRIYIAFGHAYLPYALSSLSKDPSMIWKLAKEVYKKNYLSTFTKCTSNN